MFPTLQGNLHFGCHAQNRNRVHSEGNQFFHFSTLLPTSKIVHFETLALPGCQRNPGSASWFRTDSFTAGVKSSDRDNFIPFLDVEGTTALILFCFCRTHLLVLWTESQKKNISQNKEFSSANSGRRDFVWRLSCGYSVARTVLNVIRHRPFRSHVLFCSVHGDGKGLWSFFEQSGVSIYDYVNEQILNTVVTKTCGWNFVTNNCMELS